MNGHAAKIASSTSIARRRDGDQVLVMPHRSDNEVVMARPLPLECAGAIYHLTSCVNARQKVFFSDAAAFRLALPRLLT